MTFKNNVDIPDRWLPLVVNHFQVFPNDTVDFSKPILRSSLKDVYPVFILIYSLLIVSGIAMNVTMFMNIVRRKLYVQPVCAYLLNVTVCNLIMSAVVLPLSLSILLIQNWIFGKFMCFFIPMLQDIPIHASTASLFFVSLERFRCIVLPHRPKLPPIFGILVIWILAICVVLPYAIYMSYFDMEKYFGPQLAGVGICAVSPVDDIAEYIRGLFIALYAFPLALITYLHVRIGSELRKRDGPTNFMALGQRPRGESHISRGSRGSRSSQGDVWTAQEGNIPTPSSLLPEPERGDIRRHSGYMQGGQAPPSLICKRMSVRGEGGTSSRTLSPSLHQYEEVELEFDFEREKRDQRYLVSIMMAFSLCLCPLMILRLVKNMVLETFANSAHFDLTFITFVWVAFLSTVTTPAIFGIWQMNRPIKEQLQGYFRFSGHDHQHQHFPPPPSQQQPEMIRRCSSNLYTNQPQHGMGPSHHSSHPATHGGSHSPHPAGMTAHRLSIEGSLSVSSHLRQSHNLGRPLTPTPSHSHGLGNSNFVHADRYSRPHSLSFSS